MINAQFTCWRAKRAYFSMQGKLWMNFGLDGKTTRWMTEKF